MESNHPLREAVLLLPNLVKLAYRLARDPRIARRTRWFAGLALAYAASPIDLIPDALPVLGQVDDLVVVVIALRALLDEAGPEVVGEHWDGPIEVVSIIDGLSAWAADRVPRRLRLLVNRVLATERDHPVSDSPRPPQLALEPGRERGDARPGSSHSGDDMPTVE